MAVAEQSKASSGCNYLVQKRNWAVFVWSDQCSIAPEGQSHPHGTARQAMDTLSLFKPTRTMAAGYDVLSQGTTRPGTARQAMDTLSLSKPTRTMAAGYDVLSQGTTRPGDVTGVLSSFSPPRPPPAPSPVFSSSSFFSLRFVW